MEYNEAILKELIGDSTVRGNMINDRHYTPYCGNNTSRDAPGGCSNPRTYWDTTRSQMVCPKCGWISAFPTEFVKAYKSLYNTK